MKALKTALIGAILVMSISSCGNSEPVAVETTTTTISYGKDCNKIVEAEMQRLRDVLTVAWDNATTDGVPTREEHRAKSMAMKELRSYVRSLDIPTLTVEQNGYVDAMENYLIAYNQYIESGKRDLSVNDYIIPFTDAEDDFASAWNAVCQFRSA
jgi:hypothetical protein